MTKSFANEKQQCDIAVQACFKEICGDQTQDFVPLYALIALRAPGYDDIIFDTRNNEIVAQGSVIKVEFDSDGCFKSCPLVPNSSLNLLSEDGRPCSYYELLIIGAKVSPDQDCDISSGPSCGCSTKPYTGKGTCKCKSPSPKGSKIKEVAGEILGKERFILDGTNCVLPPCVDLVDVAVIAPNPSPSCYQDILVKGSETPWIGSGTCCITVEHGDNPCGFAGNGHSPTFSINVSDHEDNSLVCLEDGLFVPCPELNTNIFNEISINNFNDIDIEGCAAGEVLQWNGVAFVCGPKAQITANDSDCITSIVEGHGSATNPWVITSSLNVSSESNNAAVCLEDGLFVPKPEPTYIEVENTKTINSTLDGSGIEEDPYIVSSSLNIDDKIGDNCLICTDDGVYVAPTNIISCFDSDCNLPQIPRGINLTVTGSGKANDPTVICPELIICPTDDNLLSITDFGLKVPLVEVAETVIQVLFGDPDGPNYPDVDIDLTTIDISSILCVSDKEDNCALLDGNNCIYVPKPDFNTSIVGTGGKGIDLTVSGLGTETNPYDIYAFLQIDDTNPKNILECNANGLVVLPTSIEVSSHCGLGCVDLRIDGCGSTSDPYVLDGFIKIVEDDCNNIICTPDGLFSPRPDGSETKIKDSAGNCTVTYVEGSGQYQDPYCITTNVVVDDSALNALVCGSHGLFVPKVKVEGSDNGCVETEVYGLGSDESPLIVNTKLNIAQDDANCITCTPAGLMVAATEIRVESESTCIDIGVQRFNNKDYVLKPDLNISEAEGNAVQCLTDGLYVKATEIKTVGIGCIELNHSGTGTQEDPYCFSSALIIDSVNDNALQCGVDGLVVSPRDVIEFVGHGLGKGLRYDHQDVEINVNISSEDKNNLVCRPDGLFVPCPDGSETDVQFVDGSCIDANISGSGTDSSPYILSADISLSDDPKNLLRCTTEGLFASSTELEVRDSSCIELDLSGLGTPAAPFILQALAITSDDSNNAITCAEDGLYAKDQGYLALHEDCNTEDSCLNVSLVGTGCADDEYLLNIGLNISPDENNDIVCTPNGLKVDVESTVIEILNNVGGITVIVNEDEGTVESSIAISENEGNCIGIGTDFGLYVPCADGSETIIEPAHTDCIQTHISGSGTCHDPYVSFSTLSLADSDCNALSCTPGGLYAEQRIGFEIGQAGLLSETADYPQIWRAACDGKVYFTIAGLAFGGSTSAGNTEFQICDNNGNPVGGGVIPANGDWAELGLGPIEVTKGQGFFVKIINPITDDPACGLTIQGEFVKCCGENC